jgi:hypothetical protein
VPTKNRALIPGDVMTKLRYRLMQDPAPDYLIARDIGIPAPHLSNWATGRVRIPNHWLPILARRLSCQPADLLGYVEVREP